MSYECFWLRVPKYSSNINVIHNDIYVLTRTQEVVDPRVDLVAH